MTAQVEADQQQDSDYRQEKVGELEKVADTEEGTRKHIQRWTDGSMVEEERRDTTYDQEVKGVRNWINPNEKEYKKEEYQFPRLGKKDDRCAEDRGKQRFAYILPNYPNAC